MAEDKRDLVEMSGKKIVENALRKVELAGRVEEFHGSSHDEKSHGNWATGMSDEDSGWSRIKDHYVERSGIRSVNEAERARKLRRDLQRIGSNQPEQIRERKELQKEWNEVYNKRTADETIKRVLDSYAKDGISVKEGIQRLKGAKLVKKFAPFGRKHQIVDSEGDELGGPFQDSEEAASVLNHIRDSFKERG